jgi:hypothetical protein
MDLTPDAWDTCCFDLRKSAPGRMRLCETQQTGSAQPGIVCLSDLKKIPRGSMRIFADTIPKDCQQTRDDDKTGHFDASSMSGT